VRVTYIYLVSILSIAWVGVCSASAQRSYEGVWLAGPREIDVSIKSWGVDCGSRPTSTRKPGGGDVRIEQKGFHLYIYGRDRTISTDACWSPNRSMSRMASTFLDGLWTVRCRTAPDDPKAEQGEYTIRATDENTLYYKELSNYNWELKESNCVATITVTQTLTRVDSSGAAKSSVKSATATKEPSEKVEQPESQGAVQCQAGAANKLVILPKKIEIAPGRRICFRAHAEDESGCALQDLPIEWSLHHPKALRGQLVNNCFTAANNAAEAEGEFRVVATAGTLRAQSLIVVKPIDLSDIIARRIETAAVSGFEKRGESDEITPQSAVEITQKKVKVRPYSVLYTTFVIGGSALIVVLLGLLIWLRRRPQNINRLSEEPSDESTRSTDYTLREEQSPLDRDTHDKNQQWICPTCRRGYSSETRTCPKDSTTLLPYDQFIREHKAQHATYKRKKCPKCGEIYPPTVAFCANDGTALVEEES
jgi:hypothetical protein